MNTVFPQVTIREKVEIKPSGRNPSPTATDMTIVFEWFALVKQPNYYPPIDLSVTGPCNGSWGYDIITGTTNGSYSYNIVDQYSDVYYCETICTINDPKPGYYQFCAIADTSKLDIYPRTTYYQVNIYLAGQYDTTIILDRYGWGGNYEPYSINCESDGGMATYLLEGDPFDPGGYHFHFSPLGDVEHGAVVYPNAKILNGCGVDVTNPPEQYFKFVLSDDSLIWGELRDPATGKTGAILDSVTSTYIEYDSWGKEPDIPTSITVRISAENGSITPDEVTFNLLPSRVKIVSGRSILPQRDTINLSRGDTTMFTMQVQEAGGTWIDKPSDWQSIFRIAKSDTFGGMYSLDSSQVGDSLTDIQQVVYSAKLDMNPDSVEVLIQLLATEPCTDCLPTGIVPVIPTGYSDYKNGNRDKALLSNSSQIKLKDRRTPYIGTPGGGFTHYGLARLMLRKYEILLGETKYYYLKIHENSGQYEIEESSEPNATGVSGVQFTVERLPVNAIRQDNKPDGTRCGVYYEYKNENGDGIENQIRLIGRYWHADSTYVVKLNALIAGEVKGTAIIEVKKPRKLGIALDPTVEDVFGNQIMINDTIIKYAGIYGIPPQIIKGQIAKETHFEPVYRYEFNEDIKYRNMTELDKNGGPSKNEQYFGAGNNFVVNSPPPMGNGPTIPLHTVHKYVPPIGDYPRNRTTIRDYLIANRYEYIERNGLIFMDDKPISDKWFYYYYKLSREGVWSDEIALQNEALSKAMQLLSDGTIGRKEYDWYAQTRIMASYGFLQLTHYNATDLGLYGFTKTSSTQPPEYLNEVSYGFRAYGERMYKYDKIKEEVWSKVQVTNWPLGYEKTWEAVLDWYNHGEKNMRSM